MWSHGQAACESGEQEEEGSVDDDCKCCWTAPELARASTPPCCERAHAHSLPLRAFAQATTTTPPATEDSRRSTSSPRPIWYVLLTKMSGFSCAKMLLLRHVMSSARLSSCLREHFAPPEHRARVDAQVNYFGRARDIENIVLSPILLKVGSPRNRLRMRTRSQARGVGIYLTRYY
eukprot:5472801-Pleurochrysis_carterae.AAC.1